MGYNTALDFADLDLEQGIAMHLQGNHYPPVPLSMVQPCIDAIDAYYDEDFDTEIIDGEVVERGLVERASAKLVSVIPP